MKALILSWKKENRNGKIINSMNMKKVNKVGVIGAGKMGAALAQKFAQEDFKVILADREMKFVEKSLHRNKLKKRLRTSPAPRI